MVHGWPIPSLSQRCVRLLRNWLVVICSLSFIAVNIAHAYGHAVQALPSAASQLDSVAPDNGNDLPDASGAVDHCHGCTIIGIAASTPGIIEHVTISAVVSLPLPRYLATPVSADTPPPKSTI